MFRKNITSHLGTSKYLHFICNLRITYIFHLKCPTHVVFVSYQCHTNIVRSVVLCYNFLEIAHVIVLYPYPETDIESKLRVRGRFCYLLCTITPAYSFAAYTLRVCLFVFLFFFFFFGLWCLCLLLGKEKIILLKIF